MSYEIPEITEEMLNISKESLKKLFSLLETLNIDLNAESKLRKFAAMFKIHEMMKKLLDTYEEENND